MRPELGVKALVRKIRDAIAASAEKSVSFRDFMEMCLYDPQDGYYMNDKPKLGKDGDFYTSAHIGGIFAEVLGKFVIDRVREWAEPVQFVEWGGGTGRLAGQMLAAVQRADPAAYERLNCIMVEASGYHRSLQREALAAHHDKVRFLTPQEWRAETLKRPAIVFANELLDAFPVHRVRQTAEGLQECCVAWDDSAEALAETWKPCSDDRLHRYVETYAIRLAEGQIAEINLAAEEWIRREAARLKQGWLVAVDYGDCADEVYAPHRMKGTLLCYRRHTAHDNPYVYVGQQDITAHVNFTSCLKAGAEAGLPEGRLLTQKQFLLENGILELLADHASADPFSDAARRNRAIRQLLLSDQLSELFKVCLLTKKR